MAHIQGETIRYRASEAAARMAGSKDDLKKQGLAIDAERQRFLKIQELRGRVQAAEIEVARIRREAADLDATIADAREVAAKTGHRHPDLYRMSFEAAELPGLIDAAMVRANVLRNELADAVDRQAEGERITRARATAEAEIQRQAVERANQVEALTQANLKAEPVPNVEIQPAPVPVETKGGKRR